MTTAPHVCTRCGTRCALKDWLALELDTRTQRYTLAGLLWVKHSGGLFLFGRACALAQLHQQDAERLARDKVASD